MNNHIRYSSLIYGCVLGFCLLFITTLFYIYDSELILPQISIYSILFFILLCLYTFYAVKKISKKHNLIKRDFKIYFSISFLIMAVSFLISRIHFFILYNFIDSNLILEYIAYIQGNMQLNDEKSIDFSLQMKRYFTLSGQLQAYVFSLIPCTLYSAIISLLMKITHK